MTELQLCPLCGGEAEITEAIFSGVLIGCTNCCCRLQENFQTTERAIAAWNRRPEPKEIIPNRRIPGIGKCPICKQELCMDDENLHYCPTCGTHLVAPKGGVEK